MRWLFLGDIVGSPGIRIVLKSLPQLRKHFELDLIVVNAENATAGSGMNPSTYRKFRDAGVDLFTMGDHIYKRLELVDVLNHSGRVAKPANFPAEAPGAEVVFTELASGVRIAVLSLLGRTYMRPVDCPFQAADRILQKIGASTKHILVDVHAEATADKYLLFHHLKGRVSAVLGTHTHVPTADAQIQQGTAFQCDVGMTGPYEGILGRRIDRVLTTTLSFVPTSFEVAEGDARLSGAIIQVDAAGQATTIEPFHWREQDLRERGLYLD